MIDLFGDSDKMTKVKKPSKSGGRERSKIVRQESRNNMAFNAIDRLPSENEVMSFVSMGMSDAGSFLNVVVSHFGHVEEANICTWTISKKNIDRILEFVDNGKIKKLNFLINDGLLKTNSTKTIYAYLRLQFDKRSDEIKYAVANCHAKIQCYKTKDKTITISGSGNWSENPRIENYILIGGKKTYNFNAEWIKDICNG